MNREVKPEIAVITALPKEYVAMKVLLNRTTDQAISGRGGGHRYLLGYISKSNGQEMPVILSLADMGNNMAATRTTQLLTYFPTISSIIMTGIAGGIPNPQKPAEHVRLGDIVVSDHRGVIQYDFGKQKDEEMIYRYSPRPPSASLLDAAKSLQVGEYEGKYPWLGYIELAMSQLNINKPSSSKDILFDDKNTSAIVGHPKDSKRVKNQPRVFYGPIASANIVLSSALKRNTLRDKFGVKAVEMEGSGIADATWNNEVGYLVIRGICDYCDGHKNDDWQDYAAIVAAAYTRALLETMLSSHIGTNFSGYTYNFANIKQLMLVGLSEQEVREIISDHFPEVGIDVSDRMPFREVVQQLVDHCKRQNRVPELLICVKIINPARFQEFEHKLVNDK